MATPVEIVRPTPSRTEAGSLAFVRILVMALSVFIVMLALGALTPWHLGYWETWLAVLAFRAAQVPSNHLAWTRGKKGRI